MSMKLTYSEQKEVWRKRRERAHQLRTAGMSLDEIAAALSVAGEPMTKQRVHQMIKLHERKLKKKAPSK